MLTRERVKFINLSFFNAVLEYHAIRNDSENGHGTIQPSDMREIPRQAAHSFQSRVGISVSAFQNARLSSKQAFHCVVSTPDRTVFNTQDGYEVELFSAWQFIIVDDRAWRSKEG